MNNNVYWFVLVGVVALCLMSVMVGYFFGLGECECREVPEKGKALLIYPNGDEMIVPAKMIGS